MNTKITCNVGIFETVRNENESNLEVVTRVLKENFKEIWYNNYGDVIGVITVNGRIIVDDIAIYSPPKKLSLT